MKFFIDSADPVEIRGALERGVARGITTNPTLLRQQTTDDPIGHLAGLTAMAGRAGTPLPLSVQVMSVEPDEMIRQARLFVEKLDYDNLVIKIPCGWDNLRVVSQLSRDGFAVNCTACITINQALLAASAGARYVSMFYGKMSDSGIDAAAAVGTTATALRSAPYDCELIVGSIRKPYDVLEMAVAGAHIATVPYDYLIKIAGHEKTGEAVDRFAANFQPI